MILSNLQQQEDAMQSGQQRVRPYGVVCLPEASLASYAAALSLNRCILCRTRKCLYSPLYVQIQKPFFLRKSLYALRDILQCCKGVS
jgi:hypothetical protein